MKKLFAILLSMLLVLSLASCSGEGTPSPSGDAGQTADAGEIGGSLPENLEDGSWKQVDEDEPFGQYHTEEELLAMLESGDFSVYESNFETETEPLVVEAEEGKEAFNYDPSEGMAATFSESEAAEAVKRGVFYCDWKSEMDPEALAEWEAFDPNDPEFLAQMEEAEQMGEKAQQQMDEINENIDMDAIQQQMDEAMDQLEGMDLPEGYEQYLPDGFDLESLMP